MKRAGDLRLRAAPSSCWRSCCVRARRKRISTRPASARSTTGCALPDEPRGSGPGARARAARRVARRLVRARCAVRAAGGVARWAACSALSAAAPSAGALAVVRSWFLLLGGLVAADAKLSLRADHRARRAARPRPRLPERSGWAVCVALAALIGLAAAVFVLVVARAALVVSAAGDVGADRRARRGKLDRRERLAMLGWAVRGR